MKENIFLKFICFCLVGQWTYGQNALPILLKSRYQSGSTSSRIEVLENKDTIFVSNFHFQNMNTNTPDIVEKKYKGTPIFKNAWFANSTIFLDGKANVGNLAFNLLNSEVQFSPTEISDAVIVKPDSFLVNNTKFIQIGKKYKLSNNRYFIPIVSTDKGEIYQHYDCSYRPKYQSQRTGYEVSADDFEGEYIKNTSIYLYQNNHIIEMKGNSLVFKQFAERKSEMEAYAKSQNLNPKKQKDLIEITKYYLTIL